MLVGAGPRLAAQAELLDEGAIALEILPLKVVQEAAAAADELQQATTRVVVVLVTAQVLGELVDALCQHRDLHLRRAGVGLVFAELLNVLQLLFLGEGHPSPLRRFFTPLSSPPTNEEEQTRH